MGSGSWDSTTYTRNVSAAAAAGKSSFDYHDQIRSGAISETVNELLDPKVVAGPTSPFAGKVMREVTITDEHPNPTPIAIVLDVTASNGTASRAVHAKLPQLFGLLQRKGMIEDPQINMCAIGDAYTDRVPLQVGQFESDNRIDAQLEAMYLEGGGGGQVHETYELGAYFLAYHTHLEPFHKQGRKGYAIFIGDEKPYDKVRKDHVKSLIGVEIEADLDTKDVFAKLAEQYEVFFLFQEKSQMYTSSQILPTWTALLNENATRLENPDNVCEFIAGLLLQREGGLDLDEIADELTEAGFDPAAIASASKTLALVGGGSGGAVAKTDGSLGIDDSTGTTRL